MVCCLVVVVDGAGVGGCGGKIGGCKQHNDSYLNIYKQDKFQMSSSNKFSIEKLYSQGHVNKIILLPTC